MRNIFIIGMLLIGFVVFLIGCSSGDNHGKQSTSHGTQVSQGNHGGIDFDMDDFSSNRYEYSDTAIFNGSMNEVFPLLSPEAENEYAPGWNSTYLWTRSGLAEEGAVFVTGPETWIITEYEENEKVYFVRYNDDVITYLKIDLEDHGEKVLSTWTQSGVGLTDAGNKMIENYSQENVRMICKSMMVSLNYYLENGQRIDDETFKNELGHDVGH